MTDPKSRSTTHVQRGDETHLGEEGECLCEESCCTIGPKMQEVCVCPECNANECSLPHPEFACAGETYFSVSGCASDDVPITGQFECDGAPDCGWKGESDMPLPIGFSVAFALGQHHDHLEHSRLRQNVRE